MIHDIAKLYRIALWAIGDDTGLSSKFLASCVLEGIGTEMIPEYPRDNGDFGRCYRFSKLLSVRELETALKTAGMFSDEWCKIRDHWDELVEAHQSDGRAFCRLLQTLIP